MILIDTDILTLLFYENPKVVNRWHSAPLIEAVTIITRAEMLRGRLDGLIKAGSPDDLIRAQERLRRTEEFLVRFRVIPLDNAAVQRFEELRRSRPCRAMGMADLLNASIALVHDATLVTRNVDDYRRVPGLKLENWAD